MLEAAGCRDISTYNNMPPPGECIHEMGTARMGRDPKTSVLNGWNQVWDAPNVFVTDGACMTSASCVNPSLTYMALTARAADHAVCVGPEPSRQSYLDMDAVLDAARRTGAQAVMIGRAAYQTPYILAEADRTIFCEDVAPKSREQVTTASYSPLVALT